jgi:hypothetical protein
MVHLQTMIPSAMPPARIFVVRLWPEGMAEDLRWRGRVESRHSGKSAGLAGRGAELHAALRGRGRLTKRRGRKTRNQDRRAHNNKPPGLVTGPAALLLQQVGYASPNGASKVSSCTFHVTLCGGSGSWSMNSGIRSCTSVKSVDASMEAILLP